jgi:hypothetical protein
MDELKACPFCGGENHPYHKEGCFLIDTLYTTLDAYNTRPIEDALRARIEELTIPADVLETAIDAVDGQRIATDCLKLGTPEYTALLKRTLDWLTAYKEAQG